MFLPILGVFIVVSVVVLFIVGFVSGLKANCDEAMAACSVIGLGFVILACIPVAVHNGDAAKLQFQSEIIEINQQLIQDLNESLAAITLPTTSTGLLANGDSPIAAIVTKISDAQFELVKAKKLQVSLRKDIFARERFVFAYATWLIPTSDAKE